MYPKAIESYFAPTTVDAALRLLAEHRDSAKLLAGGQSLMPMRKLRLVEPGCLIDLNRIPVLWPMRAGDDSDWRLAGAAGVCAAGGGASAGTILAAAISPARAQLETLFSEASETALVCFFSVDMLYGNRLAFRQVCVL